MLRLEPMTAAEFSRYLGPAIEGYAEAHRKAGDCAPEEALALAKADYENLLPLGVETPNHRLLSIFAGESPDPVGMIWYEERERRGRKSAYIFDFQVEPQWRGKGYGSQTLRELERVLAQRGVSRISLNVMGWNHAAKALYERAGFTVAGIGMTKVVR